LLLLVALTVTVFAGTALAGGGPATKKAMATFTVTANKTDEKDCVGEDGGAYRDVKATFLGTISGNDPRLTGNFEVRGDSLVNTTLSPGPSGTTTGKMTVRNSVTGKKTFEGDFVAVNTGYGGGVLKGFITGNLPDSMGDKLFANFSAEFRDATSGIVDGELGNASATTDPNGDDHDPAVIQRGECRR
jgi:hypothetical protein